MSPSEIDGLEFFNSEKILATRTVLPEHTNRKLTLGPSNSAMKQEFRCSGSGALPTLVVMSKPVNSVDVPIINGTCRNRRCRKGFVWNYGKGGEYWKVIG